MLKHIRPSYILGAILILISTVFLALSIAQEQETTLQGYPATIFERAIIRSGPSMTYAEVGGLGAGVEITILERNTLGNWLYIFREALPGTDPLEGWIKTGFVSLEDDFHMSDVQVNTSIAQVETTAFANDEDLLRLYQIPHVPQISNAVVDIYERGQDMGNDPTVVTKVGDSNSVVRGYLPPADEVDYDMGAYDILEETIDYFGASFQTGSIAARVGLNGFSVFDPIWSDPDCEPNEYPLACEYRMSQPLAALILFGPNDLRALNTDQYLEQMTRIVEETIDAGIIPILMTFSNDPNSEFAVQAVRFNLILADIAETFDIPLINLWAAARDLPFNGLNADNSHMTSTGVNVIFRGQESRFGVSLQNFLVLHTLDALRDKLNLG